MIKGKTNHRYKDDIIPTIVLKKSIYSNGQKGDNQKQLGRYMDLKSAFSSIQEKSLSQLLLVQRVPDIELVQQSINKNPNQA